MRIYVSSTSRDLKDYREQAVRAIRRQGHEAVVMEDYVAEDRAPAEKCVADVANCDLYVGIVARRYGCVPKGQELSITEMEYRQAVEDGIPVLAFLLHEEADWPEEFVDTGEAGERIRALREELCESKVVDFFQTPTELRAKVAEAIGRFVHEGQRQPAERIVGMRTGVPGFKDRMDELSQVRALLKDEATKFACIVGACGIGKTWLLSEVCEEIEEGRLRLSRRTGGLDVDGVIYADCSKSPGLTLERVFDDVGRMLGTPYAQELMDCWADQSRSVGEKIRFLLSKLRRGCYLLVMDSFEVALGPDNMISDEAMREFVDEVLQGSHGLRLLATSHRTVVVEPGSERAVSVFDLDHGLPGEDAVTLLRDLDRDGRAHLRRAPDQLLQEIARRCECVPGALQLIPVILRRSHVPPTRLLEDESLFDERVVENLAATHYSLATEEERRVLQGLAVYNRPVTANVVRHLLEPFFPNLDIEECLFRLEDNMLVSYCDETDSYALRPLYQRLAYAQIHEEGEHYRRALHRRQVEFYLEEWRRALDESGKEDALNSARQAVAVADEIGDDLAIAKAYYALGASLSRFQRFAEAAANIRRASHAAERAGDVLTLAKCLWMRSGIETEANPDYGDLSLLDVAIDLFEKAGEPGRQAGALHTRACLGMRFRKWRVVEEALKEEGKLLREEVHDPRMLTHVQQLWGEYYWLRGRWEEAADSLANALEGFEGLSEASGACAARGWLGLARCWLGDMDAGLSLVRQALQTERHTLDSREGVSKWLHYLGEMFLERSETERALEALWISRDLREELRHAELSKTKAALRRARDRIGGDRFRELEEAFDPRGSEFGEYAFLWGLGPFRKCDGNPILEPRGDGWESLHVFNPAAWTDGERVYLLYRAEGPCKFPGREVGSTLGLAVSTDGLHFEREDEPILTATEPFEMPGGCEDPRLTHIDGTFYLTYTAYDGKTARLSMAASPDLRNWEKLGPVLDDDQWELYFPNEEHRALFPRGWSKSGAMLPKKVDGHYWMYFGDTHIWAAYSADLRHWDVAQGPVLSPRPGLFDSRLVEPGPPPVVLPGGIWLGYNSADTELRYAFGQALIAPDNPTEVLRRCIRPLLEPTTAEETDGQVDQVVFGEGLVMFKGKWFLYYGMADSRIGVAIADAG